MENAMKSKRRGNKQSAGAKIIEALTELRDVLKSGAPLEDHFTVRTVEVPEPQEFDASRVQAVREKLGLSQAVFAKLVGVSKILVQSWEQGAREPSALARRLLAEMDRNPEHWRKMMVPLSVGA